MLTLFINGFKKETTLRELTAILSSSISDYGMNPDSMKNLRIIKNKKTGRGRGFAFVEVNMDFAGVLFLRPIRYNNNYLRIEESEI